MIIILITSGKCCTYSERLIVVQVGGTKRRTFKHAVPQGHSVPPFDNTIFRT